MYFNPFENLMYLCDGKAEFSVAITPVFIVIWLFRNHSKIIFWRLRNISYFLLLYIYTLYIIILIIIHKAVMLLDIFVEIVIFRNHNFFRTF